MELVDSNVQWHDVQRRQAELQGSAVQQASVMKSSQATAKQQSVTPADTDSQSRGSSHNRSRRHKKNR